MLLAFARTALDLSAPLSRTRHGLPASFDFESLDLRSHTRAKAPEWFAGFEEGPLVRIGMHDAGDAMLALPQCEAAYSIQIELEEPPDLAYLQACWAAAKWLCECGAELVQDAHAIRWHTARSLIDADPLEPFALQREVSIVFETDTTGNYGHVTHTRGLAKFGRPDVMLLGATAADAHACGVLLNGLARRAALGASLEPGQTVAPNGLAPRELVDYAPGEAHPEVHLNNDGVVLDIRGWGLSDALGPSVARS